MAKRWRGLAGLGLAFTVTAASAQPAASPVVDAPGKLSEPPPSAADRAYDARLLASAAAAEQFQGPLDGGWILSAGAQGDLYGFELTDKGDHVEGAWRDLRRSGVGASGVVEAVQRSPAGVTLRFTPPEQPPVTVALGPNLRGRAEQDGRSQVVRLRRAAPWR